MLAFSAPEEVGDPTLIANVTGFVEGVFAGIVAKYGKQVVQEIGEKLAFESNAAVQSYIAETTGSLIRNVNETTKRRIRKQIAAAIDANEGVAQIRTRIESVFSEAQGIRAQMIAVTESTRLTGYAADQAIIQSGVEFKEWIATLDGHTRDAHRSMDGQVVPRVGKFKAPSGEEAAYPGGFPSASLNIRCRCAVAAAFPTKSARTDMERRAIWNLREKKRREGEKEVFETFQKIFTMQGQAVLQKIKDIAGENDGRDSI